MLRVLASLERACNDALASLARERKLEDCFVLLGLFETKKEGWQEKVVCGLLGRRWFLWVVDLLGVINELVEGRGRQDCCCVEAASLLVDTVALSSFSLCRRVDISSRK